MSPTNDAELPWLQDELVRLREARRSGRFPQSLLLQGSAGIGAEWLAQWIARALLCTQSEGAPCGECRACRWVESEQHPDLTVLRTTEDSKQIKVEQIRDLSVELGLKSHQGGARVGLILGADTLNRFAANALLKTLEEPRPGTVLILCATLPSRLPATIRSRCQVLRLAQPSRAVCIEWLQRSDSQADWAAVLDVVGDQPLAARMLDAASAAQLRSETVQGLHQTLTRRGPPPSELAEGWSRSELPLRLRVFETWLTNQIRAQVAQAVISTEMRPVAHLPDTKSVMNMRPAFELLDEVRELQLLIDTPINRSLALEKLLRQLAASPDAKLSR